MPSLKTSTMLLLAVCLAAGGARSEGLGTAPGAAKTDWVLTYADKSTNEFIWDKRTAKLVQSRVPAALSSEVLAGLGGPPDPVLISEHRYASVSACVPHDCPDKSLFWIDTQTGAGLGARYGLDTLRLGSNSLSSDHLPAPALRAVIDWLTDHELTPRAVEFISVDGKKTALPAAQFAPRVSYVAPKDGPSFDCGNARTAVEKSICVNPTLAELDLAMAKHYKELRHGVGTVPAISELQAFQRQWLKERDAGCGGDADMAGCLIKQYRVQEDRLMNWIPKHQG
ncbi:MAG: lysozyme inhibitor LprI family protein [Massilia sp.]